MGRNMKFGIVIVLVLFGGFLCWASAEVQMDDADRTWTEDVYDGPVSSECYVTDLKGDYAPLRINDDGKVLYQPITVTCDPHRAFDEFEAQKKAAADLVLGLKQIQTQAESKNRVVAAKQAELEKAKKKVKKKLEAELIDLKAELRSFLTVSNKRIVDRRREIIQNAYLDIYDVIAEVAEKKGITLVLNGDQPDLSKGNIRDLLNKLYYRQTVLYRADSLDITDEVIKVLNGKP